jgi:hypothetical protein
MNIIPLASRSRFLVPLVLSGLVAACGGGEEESDTAAPPATGDTAAPAVSITSPASSGTFNATTPNISMAGTASDAVGVTTVSWSDSRGGSGTASGTNSWSASMTVPTGSTTVTVTARDAAGNQGTASLTISYSPPSDTTPPTVTNQQPAPNATGVATNATVRATFSEAMDAATLNTTNFTLRPSASGSANVAGAVTYANNVATFTPSAPLTANTGYTATVTTGARDVAGNALASAVNWTFTTAAAAPTNRPPTISGTPPATVMVGSAYAFTPTFNDPDGDTLTFSLTGTLPSTITLNTSTGRLSGTPVAADVGTYSNLRITVSDGRGGAASLAAFSITVTATANGSATLQWTAPTTNADSTPLTDLAGYRISYGNTAGGPYTTTVTVSNPGVTSHVISQLTPGTYYFVARAYDTSGNESQNSNEATKVVN